MCPWHSMTQDSINQHWVQKQHMKATWTKLTSYLDPPVIPPHSACRLPGSSFAAHNKSFLANVKLILIVVATWKSLLTASEAWGSLKRKSHLSIGQLRHVETLHAVTLNLGGSAVDLQTWARLLFKKETRRKTHVISRYIYIYIFIYTYIHTYTCIHI